MSHAVRIEVPDLNLEESASTSCQGDIRMSAICTAGAAHMAAHDAHLPATYRWSKYIDHASRAWTAGERNDDRILCPGKTASLLLCLAAQIESAGATFSGTLSGGVLRITAMTVSSPFFFARNLSNASASPRTSEPSIVSN